MKEITIDGIKYIPESEAKKTTAVSLKGKPYKIVRTYSAGVFAGYVESKKGKEVVLRNARRLWYWDGAASLSELAEYGVSKPENCKFPCEVEEITLMQVIEIIPCTKKAVKSIKAVKIWKV